MKRFEVSSGLFLLVLLSFLFIPLWLPKNLVLGIFSSVVLGFSILAEGNKRKRIGLELILCFTILAISCVQYLDKESLPFLRPAQYILFLLSISINAFLLVSWLLSARSVSAHFVVSSINGFLVLGFFFAVWCSFLEYIVPGSYDFKGPVDARNLHLFIYFSFVTLSTLGYGDFLANNGLAQSLSLVMAIVGTLYPTLVIGMVLGKFLQQQQGPDGHTN